MRSLGVRKLRLEDETVNRARGRLGESGASCVLRKMKKKKEKKKKEDSPMVEIKRIDVLTILRSILY